MPVAVADTLSFLLGDWSLERVIEDHRDHATLTFTGAATVTPNPTGASYRESGTIRAPRHSGPAQRQLEITRLLDGAVRLDFSDGRPFIVVDLSSGQAAADHPCRADTYAMSFEATGADSLVERWRVRGPEKDYTATTTWLRR